MSGPGDIEPEEEFDSKHYTDIHELGDITEEDLLQAAWKLLNNRKRPAVALGALKELMKLKGMIEGGNDLADATSGEDALDQLIEEARKGSGLRKVE